MKLSAAASAGASMGPVDAVQTGPSTFADEPVTDLNELVSLLDFEGAAQRRIPHMVWEYYSGVADEITLRWNREAYDRLRPRVLVDVSKIDRISGPFRRRLGTGCFLASASWSGSSADSTSSCSARSMKAPEKSFSTATPVYDS